MNIPPLLSRTPPPISQIDDDYEDEDNFEGFINGDITVNYDFLDSPVHENGIEPTSTSLEAKEVNITEDNAIATDISDRTKNNFDQKCDNTLNSENLVTNEPVNHISLDELNEFSEQFDKSNISDDSVFNFQQNCEVEVSLEKSLDYEETLKKEISIELDLSNTELRDFKPNETSVIESEECFVSEIETATYTKVDDVKDDDFDDFADFQTSTITEQSTLSLGPESFSKEWFQEKKDLSNDVQADLNEKINNDSLWVTLKSLDDTPALKYQWGSSSSNHKLLSALKIDSRNILYSPWNRSTKLLGATEPKNDLLTENNTKHDINLVPQKATIPEAHFDWEGSGLTNPLFPLSKDDHLLEIDVGSLVKTISSQTEAALRSVPDLSYMKKTYIVFNKST